MTLVLTILAVLAALIGSELWWHRHRIHGEISRKFIHITVGCFAAFWPYFLSRNEILFLSAAFIAGVLVSQYFGVFKAIHAVERPTWGEICFALAVGVLTYVAPTHLIYTVALLHMALADGVAALVGTRFGKSTRYTIFGHHKSLIGSLAFAGVSGIILTIYGTIGAVPISLGVLASTAIGAAVLENIAVLGLDNLAVPLFVAGVLLIVR